MHWLLLDSASLYFRAYFGVKAPMLAPDGTRVNAVRGFLDMIATLITDHRPDALVACWDDDWRPAWRVSLIPSYKTHRLPSGSAEVPDAPQDAPDELAVQVPIIVSFLEAFGIVRVGAVGCEADDVIGTLTTTLPPSDSVDVVTGDRDLLQLIDDARRVRVLYTGKGGVRAPEVLDLAALQAKYGVPSGDAYADLATLRGDTSDGLPGVPGVGEKTAASLLMKFGSLEGILGAAVAGDPGVSRGVQQKLATAADYLSVAPQVVRVLRDADLPTFSPALPVVPADAARVASLAQQWGAQSSVDRLTKALALPRS